MFAETVKIHLSDGDKTLGLRLENALTYRLAGSDFISFRQFLQRARKTLWCSFQTLARGVLPCGPNNQLGSHLAVVADI